MNILITGASGFIGTNLIEYYLHTNEDLELLNIDIVSPRNECHEKYWSKIDICDYNVFERIVLEFNPEYIVHLAARTDILGNRVEDYPANTVGVENLIKICNKLPNLKKVLIASSMLVNKVGYEQKHILDYCPPNAYGESKVQTEIIVKNNKLNCDYNIIRPTSIWGPWFDTYRNFFEMINNGMYFHFGNKKVYKTYGYVGNAVHEIANLLKIDTNSYKYEDRIFYIGDYEYYCIEDWANEIACEYSRKIRKIPSFIIKCAALTGDVLQTLKISFPMTSFRLKNMQTDNRMNLERTKRLVPNLPFDRITANKNTIEWIKTH